jgi:hypothetical protein
VGKDVKTLCKHVSRVAECNYFSFKLNKDRQQSIDTCIESCCLHPVKETRQKGPLPLLALSESRQQATNLLLTSGYELLVLVPELALYALTYNK